jgi:hypothetical protein
MATNAVDWHTFFYRENSGTYNNQWMVFDHKLFTPGQPLPDNTFVVSEQLPGYWTVQDQTMALQRNYWASYNVPFYESVYDMSGYPAAVASKGANASYQVRLWLFYGVGFGGVQIGVFVCNLTPR